MPRYNQKITRLMTYPEFLQGVEREQNPNRQAFLTVLYLCGCRISEALALQHDDILLDMGNETLYIKFKRLKGSKQTEPQEIPFTDTLKGMMARQGRAFHFGRMTGYRIVKRAFPELYPHFFRMNSITTALQQGATIPEIRADFGLSLNAMDHYIGNVGTKRLGELRRKLVTT